MRVSIIVIAIVLLVLAVPYLLVQMDVLDAEWLRVVPATLAIVVAMSGMVAFLRRRNSRRRARDE